jgi:hypothetical protein
LGIRFWKKKRRGVGHGDVVLGEVPLGDRRVGLGEERLGGVGEPYLAAGGLDRDRLGLRHRG